MCSLYLDSVIKPHVLLLVTLKPHNHFHTAYKANNAEAFLCIPKAARDRKQGAQKSKVYKRPHLGMLQKPLVQIGIFIDLQKHIVFSFGEHGEPHIAADDV